MADIHFILGGQSSGKTAYGLTIAEQYAQAGDGLTYLATAIIADNEMKKKSLLHVAERAARQKNWQTVEDGLHVPETIKKIHGVVMVDSLALWLFNIIYDKQSVQQSSGALLTALQTSPAKKIIIVSDEINFSPVSGDKETRDFCQALGLLHQQIAKIANHVELMVAGLPLKVK